MKIELELKDEMVWWLLEHYGMPSARGLLTTIIEEKYSDCKIEEYRRKNKTYGMESNKPKDDELEL